MNFRSNSARSVGRLFGSTFPLIVLAMAATSQSALAYDKATVTNETPFDVTIVIEYPACRSDTFQVLPGKSAQPTASRGGCLISKISASFYGRAPQMTVTPYQSSGTSYSNFILFPGTSASPDPLTQGFQIYSDHELDAIFAKLAAPPKGSYLKSCRRAYSGGRSLFATCADSNGSWVSRGSPTEACVGGDLTVASSGYVVCQRK